jgi:ribosomal protein S18 acetylase RimI-like enzyme
MTVREATADDVEAIRDVARASWERDYPEILSRETAEEGVMEWYTADAVRDAVVSPRTRLFVAVDDDAVVGFAHAILDSGSEGYIMRLYVHPEHRGEGIGTALAERVRTDLFERGADRVHAMVLADNDLGNAFYRDLDFERTAEATTTIGGESFREYTYTVERA